MKKISIIIYFLFTAVFAQAQIVGNLNILGNRMEERGDTLHLEIDMQVKGIPPGKLNSWIIIPELATQDRAHVAQLPAIRFNGKHMRQMDARKSKLDAKRWRNLQYHSVLNVIAETDTVFSYRIDIPYNLWMDDASLVLRQVQANSNKTEQIYEVFTGSSVKLESRIPYEVNPSVTFIKPEKENKTRDIYGQAYLDFENASSVILPNFRKNPQELAKIRGAIEKIQNNRDITIKGIYIEGYASPDGNYYSNERLSRDRALAVRNYIRNNYYIPDHLFRVTSIAEDWGGLRNLVEESNIQHKNIILDIIDSDDPYDARERRLAGLAGGRPYQIIFHEMYPQLRRVEYRIDFTVRDYSLEEAKVLKETNPEYLSPYEYDLIADTYKKRSLAFNELYELAVKYNPEDPVANINGAAVKLARGEIESAKKHLDKAGNDVRAWNNLGVYYLLTDELDKAEDLFKKAIVIGQEEAVHNLEEVKIKKADKTKMQRYENK